VARHQRRALPRVGLAHVPRLAPLLSRADRRLYQPGERAHGARAFCGLFLAPYFTEYGWVECCVDPLRGGWPRLLAPRQPQARPPQRDEVEALASHKPAGQGRQNLDGPPSRGGRAAPEHAPSAAGAAAAARLDEFYVIP